MRLTLIIAFHLLTFIARAQLILPGDYPDPSVTKIGDTYWASATTSNWAPVFPMLMSSDLIHWETRGFVFPTLPDWADYYFWAPEISYENGKTYVYYSAHKKGGNLCVGIASANSPEGPYTDHGPIVCQRYGSIDAFPIRDTDGKLFLVWKEDANSVGRPTSIWMCELREDRSGLIGEKVELFKNNAPWESNLVEGVSMMRHGEYFYAFYAAAGCCGKDCSYATGVARAKELIGPWEKFENNPVLSGDEDWLCPGHGTPILKDGKYYFMLHAYNRQGGIYVGRQGLLREFEFTTDGWIKFLPMPKSELKAQGVKEQFEGHELGEDWQWSVFEKPRFELGGGKLSLFPSSEKQWTFIAQKSKKASYKVRVRIDMTSTSAEAGLAAVGDEKNLAGVSVREGKIKVWKTHLGKDTIVVERDIPSRDEVFLEMKVSGGSKISFAYSLGGRSYKTLNRRPLDGAFIPPWDRAVRIGLLSRGRNDQKAVYKNFILYH